MPPQIRPIPALDGNLVSEWRAGWPTVAGLSRSAARRTPWIASTTITLYWTCPGTPRTLKFAAPFAALAKEHHPDSRGAAGSGESSQRDFRLITEAYETLKDANRRAAYDRELDEARQLEAAASRTGRRSYAFAAGLGVGILLAVVAVGAVAYIDRAGHRGGEKAQDSLQRLTAL